MVVSQVGLVLRGPGWPDLPSRSTAREESSVCLQLDLERWWKTLSLQQRRIIQWAYQGHTEEEMARRLGLSRGAVRRRRRAMAKAAPVYLSEWGVA